MEELITLDTYQAVANSTAVYAHVDYPFMGIGEEVGELLGKLAKHSRKNDMTLNESLTTEALDGPLREDLLKELGDVLWMLSQCADALDTDLDNIAKINMTKLADRQERGVLVGEGDNR